MRTQFFCARLRFASLCAALEIDEAPKPRRSQAVGCFSPLTRLPFERDFQRTETSFLELAHLGRLR
jgi:hypothetical protein